MYYKDLFAAAYMAREFSVNLESKFGDDYFCPVEDYIRQDCESEGLSTEDLIKFLERGVQYIEPDSYYIFEPQVGDLVSTSFKGKVITGCVEGSNFAKLVVHGVYNHSPYLTQCRSTKIIQRNNQPFFWPEIEEKKDV